ncbi:MAG: hypothetical protein O2960_19275 [Verrucomicrobia bacterium]|nr:hypothetical protein [Verrucomicrobiota bacterium]
MDLTGVSLQPELPSTRHYGGMLHGFLHFAELFDDGKRAVTELGQAIKAKLSK